MSPPHVLLKNFMNSNWKEGYLTVLRLGFLIEFFEKATRHKQVRLFLKRLKMIMNGELGNRFRVKSENED
jgi:hypothetical protein